MRAFLQRVHEALVYWGEVEFRALRDTWRHVVAHVFVSFAIFVLATAIRCASLPKGKECDLTDLQAGVWAAGIWLGIVLAFNLLMAPVRMHREQRVLIVASANQQTRLLSRYQLALHIAKGARVLYLIETATNVESADTGLRAELLEQAKNSSVSDDYFEIIEKVVSAPSGGATHMLNNLVNEWLDEARKDLRKIDIAYLSLFDSPSATPPPSDISGPYSPFTKNVHHHLQRLEQFMGDFRDA